MKKLIIPKNAYIKFGKINKEFVDATIFYIISNFHGKYSFTSGKNIKIPKDNEIISVLAKKYKEYYVQLIEKEDKVNANLYDFENRSF